MMTDYSPLVADYLTRLRSASASLPTDRAAELYEDIEAHLAAAEINANGSEAELRNAIDRLGSPEIVVAEIEVDESGSAPINPHPYAVAHGVSNPGRLERWAFAMVAATLGCSVTLVLVPVAMATSVAAFVMVMVAQGFRLSDKLWGMASLALSWPLVMLSGFLTFAPVQTCSQASSIDSTGNVVASAEICDGPDTSWVLSALIAGMIVAVGVHIYVLRRLNRRIKELSAPTQLAA